MQLYKLVYFCHDSIYKSLEYYEKKDSTFKLVDNNS